MTKIEEYAKKTGFLVIKDDLRKFGMLTITTNLKFFKLDYNSVTGSFIISTNPLVIIKDNERAMFISEFEKISEAKDNIEKLILNLNNENK